MTEDLVPLFAEPPEEAESACQPAPETTAFESDTALRPSVVPPARSWRRVVWRLTDRRLWPASERQHRQAERMALLQRPLTRPWTIAFLSMKGGVGKTTTCAGIGHVFAAHRGDMAVAVDCNPDGGALVQRVGQETPRTMSDLLANLDGIRHYADVRAFTSQAPSRLHVLASDRDPRAAAALTAEAYWEVRAQLEVHYSLILLDCGTGVLTDAAQAAMTMADQFVVVTSAASDAAEVSFRTIEWLEQRGHYAKVQRAVAVVNTLDDDSRVHLDVIDSAFRSRCRTVVHVPCDRHLRLGSRIDLDALQGRTREAYIELAAALAEGFLI